MLILPSEAKDLKWWTVAQTIAEQFSKDPNTKVGAVIIKPNGKLASTGYNGFPPQLKDDPALLQDRLLKNVRTIHAEMAAILNADCDLTGCSLYVWPFFPCRECAKHIIYKGITKVVGAFDFPRPEWAESAQTGIELFKEADVFIVEIAQWMITKTT